jgi:hypothetical protein
MIDPTLQEWLYAREIMRRLGFTPDELFFVVSTSGKVLDRSTGVVTDHGGPIIGLEVRAQDKEFSWTIGATKLPIREIEPAFMKMCDAWNERTVDVDAEDGALKASHSFAQRLDLLATLRARGFSFQETN